MPKVDGPEPIRVRPPKADPPRAEKLSSAIFIVDLKFGETSIGVCTNFESGEGRNRKIREIKSTIVGNHAFWK